MTNNDNNIVAEDDDRRGATRLRFGFHFPMLNFPSFIDNQIELKFMPPLLLLLLNDLLASGVMIMPCLPDVTQRNVIKTMLAEEKMTPDMAIWKMFEQRSSVFSLIGLLVIPIGTRASSHNNNVCGRNNLIKYPLVVDK